MAGFEEVQRGEGFEAGSQRLREALALARECHSGEVRRDRRTPLIQHPLAVARTVAASGLGEEAVAAALLHDAVEDCDEIDVGTVVERCGIQVGELVAALTDDDSIDDYAERKSATRASVEAAGRDAVTIYIADKLDNVRHLRVVYREIGERAGERFQVSLDERIEIWRDDTRMAARVVPGLEAADGLRAELDRLAGQRAGAGVASEAAGRAFD